MVSRSVVLWAGCSGDGAVSDIGADGGVADMGPLTHRTRNLEE